MGFEFPNSAETNASQEKPDSMKAFDQIADEVLENAPPDANAEDLISEAVNRTYRANIGCGEETPMLTADRVIDGLKGQGKITEEESANLKTKIFQNPGWESYVKAENRITSEPEKSGQNLNEVESKIGDSQDFNELFSNLDSLGGLQGAREFLPSQYLKKTIIKILEGTENDNALTKTAGLREKFRELRSRYWRMLRNDQQVYILDELRKNSE